MSTIRRPWRRRIALIGAVVVAGGLVVGYAHVRLHRLETADVAWSAPSIQGDTAVADGRAYTYDPSDGLRINQLSDGTSVADDFVGGNRMYLGRSGHFAVLDLDQMTFYSPTGKKLWTRQLPDRDPLTAKPQAIGDGTIAFQECRGKTCALVNLDEDGETLWRQPLDEATPSSSIHTEDVQQPPSKTSTPNLRLVPSVPVQVQGGRLTALDETGAPQGESIRAKDSTIVGDLLIELGHEGDECTYRAVRGGTVQWTSRARCEGDSTFEREPLYVLALSDRLYATYSGADNTSRMVSLDLETGRTTGFDFIYDSGSRTSTTSVHVGDDVVVKQDKRRLTGISPATGKVLWRYTDHGGNELYPAVEVTGDTVNILTAPRDVWRTLAVGHEYPNSSITFLDARSGRTRAHFMRESIYGTTVAPGGGTLVTADDQLFLVGKD